MAKNKDKKEEKGTVKVEILASNMAGKYGMPHNPGHKIEVEAKQAKEMIDAGDAKEVK